MRSAIALGCVLVAACGEPPPTPPPPPSPFVLPPLPEPELVEPAPPFVELGAQAGRVLSSISRIEVLALGDRAGSGDTFDGFRVLRRTTVDAGPIVIALRQALGTTEPVPLCFEPHHGLRAVSDEGTLEISVCFGCRQIHVVGGRYVPISGDELEPLLSGAIEAAHGLRFEGSEGTIGHWAD